MKKRQFIIFLLIVNTINLLINGYIYYQGYTALTPVPEYRLIFTIAMILLSFSYMAGKILERFTKGILTKIVVTTGQIWMAAMAFLLFSFLLYDAVKLVLFATHIIPSPGLFITSGTHGYITAGIFAVVSVIIAAGMINASNPVVKRLSILSGKNNLKKKIRVVMASDIHLGMTIGKKRLSEIVAKINAEQPDVILLPGDVFDEDLGVVIEENHGEALREFKSRYGVYAVPGNHEYFGNINRAVAYLEEHNIKVLQDTTVTLEPGIVIAGRDDLTRKSMTGEARVPLQTILNGIQETMPVIVMDHQPARLNESVENKVTLHLSGHTHHGQMFPFSLITKKIYELSWGYKKKENTHLYVSCGVGTWGPPVRIGNRPEIVVFDIS